MPPSSYAALDDGAGRARRRLVPPGRVAPVLRVLLCVYNALLALAGVALAGWAGLAYVAYHPAGGGGDPSSPALETGGSGDQGASPWFVYVAGLAGAYMLGTGLLGASGAKAYSSVRLALYVPLLVGLVLAEAAALVLLFGGDHWRRRLPRDASGWWDATLAAAQAHARAAKQGSLGLLASQLAALGAAAWLHALCRAAYEAWLDQGQERADHVRARLDRVLVQTYSDGDGSTPWGRRMRSKYGVSEACWENDAADARQAALLAGNWQALEP